MKASGNPAVLTLAEADAELQRLAILKRNHADEQYVARRNLRELPETITRLRGRIAGLEQDINTIATHADDTIMIGGRRCLRVEGATACREVMARDRFGPRAVMNAVERLIRSRPTAISCGGRSGKMQGR